MKHLKTTHVLALGILASLSGMAAAQDLPSQVSIATEGTAAPWNFTSPDGKLEGMEIDLANDLCARVKIKCEFQVQSFDGMIPGLLAKKFDLIMSGVTITAKREEVIAFSVPYVSDVISIAVMKNGDLAKLKNEGAVSLSEASPERDAALKTIQEAMNGKTVGVQASSISAAFAKEYLKDVATIREYKTTPDQNFDLQSGRIDAVISDNSTIVTALKGPGGDTMEIVGPKFQGGIVGSGQGLGFRKEDTALKQAFDTAIKAASADGTVKKLTEKWFGTDISVK
ncbi:transporter substrate-binding domain-containing protein [Mesorhizobium sp.]|uniref:transporter substrate-binding domain-containing protein n=1 Tax=Mesorhizobium sp. TaxID=1871066 RepID=UPI0025B84607|nr:transporter substrate-binding domain-containing protein [Mesorhizobium sp.]